MILIADSGATKTSWALINDDSTFNFQTEGYHPLFVDTRSIVQSLQSALPDEVAALARHIKKIFFYSAGVSYSKETDAVLANGISEVFINAAIFLATDLLGAARSLLKDKEGFAVILGTGSNSGFYNGTHITNNVESGGFLLGDEGSGSYLGKMLISDYVRRVMPTNLRIIFEKRYNLNSSQLIKEVYTSEKPNRYCAQFATFIGDNRDNEYCRRLAVTNFEFFFSRIIAHYENYQEYSIHAIGSVAYYLKEIFAFVACQYGLRVGEVSSSAIEGLIDYHSSRVN